MSIGSTLVCPRCKTENAPDRGFCQRCGMGLRETGTLSRSSVWDSEEWIGSTIAGKYEVLSVLGEGGFGIVFKVQLLLFEEQSVFALKMLRPDLSRNEQFRKRFLREAKTAMDLVHPNAIPVREFGQTEDGLLYFTMDYCSGESLQAILAREGYLTVNRAIPLAMQMLRVMEVAHERDIIHRDLKPDNVFVDRDAAGREEVRVADFGLAKSLGRAPSDISSDLTKGGIVGTPRYMSPEQARGEPLDSRSDLFSIGVMLFEMVTGQLPPRANGPNRGRNASSENGFLGRLRQVIPPNLVVPRGVLEVVSVALEEKPSDRYQTAREFRESLESLPTYTPTYIEPRRVKPRRSIAKVVVWTLLFVVIGAAASMLHPGIRGQTERFLASLSGTTNADDGNDPDGDDSERSKGSPNGDTPNGEGDSTKLDGVAPNGAAKDSTGDGEHEEKAKPNAADHEEQRENPQNDGKSSDADNVGETGKPVPAAFHEQPLGALDEWIAVEPEKTLKFRTTVFLPETRSFEQVITVETRVKVDGRDGYPIRVAGEEAAREYWCIDDDGFRRVQSSGTNGHTNRVTIPELLWDVGGKRPQESWQREDRRWNYRVQDHLVDVAAAGRSFEDCLVVIATLGDQTKRTYYRRGIGEVRFESIGPDGRLLMKRERVLD